MAKAMTAAQWKKQLTKWRVNVVYLDGWDKRGRPESTAGGPLAPNGGMIHHTGSDSQTQTYIDWLFNKGRPAEGIPAPLANSMTMMDGTLIMGAVGKANHAGKGVKAILDQVIAETISMTEQEEPGSTGSVNGNPRFYGNEVAFDGGQPMTPAQYETTVRWAAAICDFHHWTAASIIGHGEWTTAKWDPGHTDMAQFRRDVAALLAAGPDGDPEPTPKPPKPKGGKWFSALGWNLACSNPYGKATWSRRFPKIVKACTDHYSRDVLMFTEAWTKAKHASATKQLNATGFTVPVYFAGRAIAVRDTIKTGRTDTITFKERGPKKDSRHGVIAEAFPDGSGAVLAVAHYEHRDGAKYDRVRVAQAKEFRAWVEATCKAWGYPLDRVLMYADENSRSWVSTQAMDPDWPDMADRDKYANAIISTLTNWSGAIFRSGYRPDKMRAHKTRPVGKSSTSVTYAGLSDHQPVLTVLDRR